MKRILTAILAALLIVGAAYADNKELSFTLTGITNSDQKSYGATYDDFACQVTNRTGIDNTVIELQGSIKSDISNDLSWTALANSAVVNTTAAASDNDSWHIQSLAWYANTIRMKALSGVGVANTVTGVCRPGGS